MLSEKQMEQRKGKATASLVPAILGCDSYKNKYDAYLEVRGELDRSEAGDAAMLGHYFEEPMLRYVHDEIGLDIKKTNVWRVNPTHGLMGATLDAQAKTGEIIECKTSGLLNKFADLSEWGETGTDHVPLKVIAQVAAQMISCPEAQCAIIPALLGGVGLRIYRIDREPEMWPTMLEDVEKKVLEFMHAHVIPGIPPANEATAQLDSLSRMKRKEGKRVVVSLAVANKARQAQAVKDAAEGEWKIAKAELMQAIGDGEIAVDGDGNDLATYKAQSRKGFAGKQFKMDHPALYEKYSKVSTFRRFLIKKEKS